MKNEYEIRGDVTAIIINSPKHGRLEVLISTSKLERAKEFPMMWYVNFYKNSNTYYVQGMSPVLNGKRKADYLHRWLTNAPKDMVVDHINHNGLINTDENLRIVTSAENQQNRRGAEASNKSSGIRGVTWHKNSGKWYSQIGINKNTIYLGCFDDLADAESAVKEARAKYMPFSQEAS